MVIVAGPSLKNRQIKKKKNYTLQSYNILSFSNLLSHVLEILTNICPRNNYCHER